MNKYVFQCFSGRDECRKIIQIFSMDLFEFRSSSAILTHAPEFFGIRSCQETHGLTRSGYRLSKIILASKALRRAAMRFGSVSISHANAELEVCKPELEVCKPKLDVCKPKLELCEPELKVCKPELEVCKPKIKLYKVYVRVILTPKRVGSLKGAESVSWA